jgi:hypothetical protein
VATWEDVARIFAALPEVEDDAKRDRWWRVRGKSIAHERPLRRSDLEHLGEAAPDGPILGVHVADESEKRALLAEDPDVFFTTPHFDGYPMVLVQLDAIAVARLQELLTEAWLARAPKRMADVFLNGASS